MRQMSQGIKGVEASGNGSRVSTTSAQRFSRTTDRVPASTDQSGQGLAVGLVSCFLKANVKCFDTASSYCIRSQRLFRFAL